MAPRQHDPTRLTILCDRLAAATVDRQADWHLDGDDRFTWTGGDGVVSITSRDRDGEPPYELAVFNRAGEKVDELVSDLVGDDEPAPWNDGLRELYRIARRSALRADEIIDALIAGLPPRETSAQRWPQPLPS